MAAAVSIIIPTRNRAYVLWRAILSIQAQTRADWELIVVDDGSEDATSRLMEEFQDPRIRYHRTTAGGPSRARNLGVGASRCDLITYLDSDNTWRPDFLATMLAAADKHPGRLWYCGQYVRRWERRRDGTWLAIDEEAVPRRHYSLAKALNFKGPDANSILHTRQAWREAGGWDEACWWLEDWDFFLRILMTAPEECHWVEAILVDYRQVHGSGADGICGEAREDRHREVAGRRYLLKKWGPRLTDDARRRLSFTAEELPPFRASAPHSL